MMKIRILLFLMLPWCALAQGPVLRNSATTNTDSVLRQLFLTTLNGAATNLAFPVGSHAGWVWTDQGGGVGAWTATNGGGGGGGVSDVTNIGAGISLINKSNASVIILKSITNGTGIIWTDQGTNISGRVDTSLFDPAGSTNAFFRTNNQYKVLVDSADTTPGYVKFKVVGGTSIDTSVGSPGGDEIWTISVHAADFDPAGAAAAVTASLGTAAFSNSISFFPGLGASNRVLTIDPKGNDTLGAADPYHALWKSAYDISAKPTNGWNESFAYGAMTAARSGDWIVFNPGTYYLPSIPLNRYGNGQSNGVNLYIQEGVTIIRTNFAAANNGGLAGAESTVGPLIIPGNNSVIAIDGTLVCTNDSAGFDSAIGFYAPLLPYGTIFPGTNRTYFGFTNWIPSGFRVFGHGLIDPPLVGSGTTNIDGVYMDTGNSETALNTNICNAFIDGLVFNGGWDNFYLNNGGAGGINLVTRNITSLSGNTFGNPSVGFHIGTVGYLTWTDYGSSFAATTLGATTGQGIVAAGPSKITLNGTTIKLIGGNGSVLVLSGGAVVVGNYDLYQEGTTTNLSHWSSNTNTAGYFSGDISLGTGLTSSQIPSLDATKITTGVFPIARLATGTPDGTKFIRDDGVLAVPAGGGSSSTFDLNQFGGAAAGTNLVKGATVTNIQAFASGLSNAITATDGLTVTNATTGNHFDVTNGNFIANGRSGATNNVFFANPGSVAGLNNFASGDPANTFTSGDDYSFIGAGSANTVHGDKNAIIAGASNRVGYGGGVNPVTHSAIVAGFGNIISNRTVAGEGYEGIFAGYSNYLGPNAFFSGIFAGGSNVVTGTFGFAGGQRAKNLHNGSFVWSDTTASDFSSTANNQFSVRASGGIVLAGPVTYTAAGTSKLAATDGSANLSASIYSDADITARALSNAPSLYNPIVLGSEAAAAGKVWTATGATGAGQWSNSVAGTDNTKIATNAGTGTNITLLGSTIADGLTVTNLTNITGFYATTASLVTSNAQFLGKITNNGTAQLSNVTAAYFTLTNDAVNYGTLEQAGIATVTNSANVMADRFHTNWNQLSASNETALYLTLTNSLTDYGTATLSNVTANSETVTNGLTSYATTTLSNVTAFYLTISNDPPVYVLTAANNGTNFIIDRANGPRQKIAANTNINIVHFTNSQAGNCDGQVSLRIFTTNNPNGAVSPIISVPTNWNAGTSNLFALISGLYATTVTNNGHKVAWMTFDGSGPGTSQTNIFWSGLMGQP